MTEREERLADWAAEALPTMKRALMLLQAAQFPRSRGTAAGDVCHDCMDQLRRLVRICPDAPPVDPLGHSSGVHEIE